MNEDIKATPGYFYLATPYSKWVHGIDDAALVAQQIAGRLMLDGWIVYTPIGHSHGIALTMGEVDPRNHEFWMRQDRPLFDAACGILVADLSGWRESVGVKMEIDWCRQMGKPAYLVHPSTLVIRKL